MSSIRDFAAAKADRRKLALVTAYDAWTARLLADAPVDAVLVGDSAMMVMHGERDTIKATTGVIAWHTASVVRGAPALFVIADLPFLSVRQGVAYAAAQAGELMRAGARAVKVEGIRGHADVVQHLVESGVPVMGHLCLQPQSVHALGGYTVQGRAAAEAAQLREDAAALEAAGAFAVVLECVPQALAREVTAALRIPTIGIGAGAGCDGQILVLHDLLGFNPDFKPRFVRRFADGAALVRAGVARYAAAVRSGKFPAGKESFS